MLSIWNVHQEFLELHENAHSNNHVNLWPGVRINHTKRYFNLSKKIDTKLAQNKWKCSMNKLHKDTFLRQCFHCAFYRTNLHLISYWDDWNGRPLPQLSGKSLHYGLISFTENIVGLRTRTYWIQKISWVILLWNYIVSSSEKNIAI